MGTQRSTEGLRDAEIHRKTKGRKDLGTQRSTEGLRNAKIWDGRDLQDWPRTKRFGNAKIYLQNDLGTKRFKDAAIHRKA